MNHRQRVEWKRRLLQNVQSTVQPQANIQTASAKSFTVDSASGIAYPAEGAAPIVLLSYQVRMGMSGAIQALVIEHMGAEGSFVDNSGNVIWHVLKNGAPVPGLENVKAQTGSIQTPAETYLLLQQNDLIQVLVECPGAPPAGNPFARLIGYLAYGGLQTYTPQQGETGNGAGFRMHRSFNGRR